MNPVETYILKQKEPFQSIMLFIRQIIFETLPKVEEKYKWNVPYYYLNGKGICYLNILKNTNFVDLGFAQGFKLTDKQNVLKSRNRKIVKSIEYPTLESVNVNQLREILLEVSSKL